VRRLVGRRECTKRRWSQNLKRFVRETGVKLVKSGYGSEEELLAKLGAGGSRFDIVVPGSGGLQTMIGRGDAMELNHDLLPNLRHLEPAFADPKYDPGNRHSVPKDYGITSFWWRAGAVQEDPRTLEECFALLKTLEHATVNFIESSNATINAALTATGSSINATDDAALSRARDLLLEVKPYIDTISASYIERGERGEIDFGLGYNGNVHRIQQARAKQDEIKFLIPEGPAQSYVNLWVVPADAPHPVAAHRFINSVLAPAAAAREMSYTGFGVPVAGVEGTSPAWRTIPSSPFRQRRSSTTKSPARIRPMSRASATGSTRNSKRPDRFRAFPRAETRDSQKPTPSRSRAFRNKPQRFAHAICTHRNILLRYVHARTSFPHAARPRAPAVRLRHAGGCARPRPRPDGVAGDGGA
jgi:spermidine/putrescine transport system substrate-binding protein